MKAFATVLILAAALDSTEVLSADVPTQAVSAEQMETASGHIRKIDAEIREHLQTLEPYRAKLNATKTNVEPLGSVTARATRQGTSYSVVIPVGSYYLAWNVAGMISMAAEYAGAQEAKFRDCVTRYKGHFRAYLADKSLHKTSVPLPFEHFAERSCNLPRPASTPEKDRARNETVSLGLRFVVLHEYAHILNGDLDRAATLKQETDADSFAMFHIFYKYTRSVRPNFWFVVYTLGILDAPVLFPTGGSPPLFERLDAVFAGANGVAKYYKDAELEQRIDKDYKQMKEEGRVLARHQFCGSQKGWIIALPGLHLDCG